jgi:hypothetical protein
MDGKATEIERQNIICPKQILTGTEQIVIRAEHQSCYRNIKIPIQRHI